MAGKGGKNPGAGRPKGAKTKKTNKIAKAEAAECAVSGELMPLPLILQVMREHHKAGRIEQAMAAAEIALPFCSAKMVTATTTATTTAEVTLSIVRDSNFYRNADRLLTARAGTPGTDPAPPGPNEGGGVRPALGQNGAGTNGSP